MLQYILVLLLALTAYIYYTFIHKPKALYNYYLQTLQSLGYKVLALPFKPFRVPYIQRFHQGYTKHKDSYYYDKHETQTYDFAIHNIVNHVAIDLINPDMIREFLSVEKVFLFPKTQIYVANMKRLLGDGVLFSQDHQWKSKRKIITSVFTFDFLKSIIPNISLICDLQMNKSQHLWKELNPNSQETQTYIMETGFNIFAHVLMVSFFGMNANNSKIQGKTPCQSITQALKLANTQATQPLGYILGSWIFKIGLKQRDRKVNHNVKVFRQFASGLVNEKIQKIRAEIKEKKDKPKTYSDLIEALVHFYNLGSQQQNQQDKYSVQDVIDEFCTLLAAASDTTSHFFKMMVYYIVETPQVQTRLRKQIEQVFHREEDMTYENLKKMKYIDCIQDEVSRIYGPGTGIFLREAAKDTQLLNVPIKKGTTIRLRQMLNHCSSKYFEDPLVFKPQRWEGLNNLHPYTVVNFSGGPRSCLGKQLAMLESKIALIKLFRRYKSIKLQKKRDEWEFQFRFLHTPQKFMTILKR